MTKLYTKLVYKTTNGIYILRHDDAFYLTADENWHLRNCILVTELFVLEFSKEFGFDISF